MTEPTDKHREEAERIIGVKTQPICGQCHARMTYGEGAPEAHVPPHWWCPQHPGAYVADRGRFATHGQQQLIDHIAAALSSRDREIREVLAGLRCATHPDCWCAPVNPQGSQQGIHTPACLAARGLWNVVIGKEHEDGDTQPTP